MIVKYSDRNFLIVNPTCIQLKFGFPPHPRGACFGPSSAAFRPHLTGGFDRTLIQEPFACTGQIHAGLEQESAILMQMTVQVFIKTTQKIPAALIEGLIQSAAGLLFKLKPVLLGTCAGAHAGTCHPKTQTKVLKTHFFFLLFLFIFPAACFYLTKARGKSSLQQVLQRISLSSCDTWVWF